MNTNPHKDIAVNFMRLLSEGKIREAFDKYVAPNFIHHNPRFKGDAEGLKKAMLESHKAVPNKIYEVKHVLEDGGFVAVHGRVQLIEKNQNLVLVHILRFENEKIAELWDIGEEIPQDSPNENGML